MDELETQIGGKYNRKDSGVFELKNVLERLGIRINYPAGDGIISDQKDFAVTSAEEQGQSFNEVEMGFLRSIKETPIHIIYNKFGDNEGYIGESASIELLYAVAHNKPVILIRKPVYAESVPSQIQEILKKVQDKFCIKAIDTEGG